MTARHLTFLIFSLCCCGIFCALGTWQIKRLHWKENLIVQMEQAYAMPAERIVSLEQVLNFKEGEVTRGSFKGKILFEKSFELSGQIDDGKPTKHLLVPFMIGEDVSILVDMGADFSAPDISSKEVEVTGVLRHAARPNRFTPPNDPEKKIWYSIDAGALEIPGLQPLVLMPEKTPWKSYPLRPPELRNQHQQYAIFWFTCAVIMLGLTVYYLARKPEKES